jgi:hypothetical protein
MALCVGIEFFIYRYCNKQQATSKKNEQTINHSTDATRQPMQHVNRCNTSTDATDATRQPVPTLPSYTLLQPSFCPSCR